MLKPIKPQNAVHPSIFALALLGPRAMLVIDRNKSISAIAAYEPTLGPKVGHFVQVRNELKRLAGTYKKLAPVSAAQIAGLDAVTRLWSPKLQHGTSLDAEGVGITDARTPESILENARSVMDTLRDHSELPFAAQALSEIETQYSSAKPAYDAAQAARVPVQLKQRELQAAAADVQQELVQLRTVVRIALGPSHIDYQRLRLRNARPGTEVGDDEPPETVEPSS
jgi:hypothetical protein